MTKKNLLIVEDDRFLAHAYALTFDPQKYNVVTLFDGKKADEYLKEIVPDLIVLDLLLPGKSGFDILRDFRKNNTTVPVIVASNLGSTQDIDKAMKLGATDYITKSDVAITEVRTKVLNLLK